ncbi:MAG: DUF2905 domain-containing protein [Campylobacterota bacterium]|nr:DUF2905 domain-containing protein [Campylobacterota bacterium]
MGNIFITVGLGLVLVGIAYKFGLLGWFGNLPGDIKYQSENTSVFFPITSMILISIVVSLLMWIFDR